MYEVKITYDVLEKLNLKEIGVYMALKKYMNWNEFTCYPSIATLAEDLSCSENTVRKYLRQLEKKGIINIEYRTKKNKRGKRWNDTNLYTFIIEKIFNKGVLQKNKGGTARVKDEQELSNYLDMNDTNTIKVELEEEFGQVIVDKALQQLSIVTSKGTIVNNLKNYLKAICVRLQAQQEMIKGLGRVSKNKPKKGKKNSGWDCSSIKKVSKSYSNDDLELILERKRQEIFTKI